MASRSITASSPSASVTHEPWWSSGGEMKSKFEAGGRQLQIAPPRLRFSNSLGELLLDERHDFFSVARRSYLLVDLGDLALLVDHEGDALGGHPLVGLDPQRLDHLQFVVGQEREIQVVVLDKLLLGGNLVRADADHDR